jgi:RHS repeat-associated protein
MDDEQARLPQATERRSADSAPGPRRRANRPLPTPRTLVLGLVQIGASCACTPYGDVFPQEADGKVDLGDILCALDGFSDPSLCPNGDIAPCSGNSWGPHGDGSLDVADLLAVLDAFGGVEVCPRTCGPTGFQCPGPVVQLQYDYRNRLVEYFDRSNGQRHTYAYDAFGRRIKKIVDVDGASRGLQSARTSESRESTGPIETRYFYGGVAMWQVIEEQDGNGATLAGYVHGSGIDELVAMDRDTDGDGQSERYFFYADDLGNVMAATDAAGQVVERYDYDDFGRPRFFDAKGFPIPGQQSVIGNSYHFTGREFDAETGLYHYRTRYYDPVVGRFLTRDIIGAWGDSEELGNAYGFVGNNPWTYLDPFGLDVIDWVQGGLDVLGFLPGVGAFPDLANAAIDALQGEWSEAGSNLFAAIPAVGDAAKGVKIGRKALRVVTEEGAQKSLKKAGTEGLEEGAEKARKESAEEARERAAQREAEQAAENAKTQQPPSQGGGSGPKGGAAAPKSGSSANDYDDKVPGQNYEEIERQQRFNRKHGKPYEIENKEKARQRDRQEWKEYEGPQDKKNNRQDGCD